MKINEFQIPEKLSKGIIGRKVNHLIHSIAATNTEAYAIKNPKDFNFLIQNKKIITIDARKLKGFFLPVIISRAKMMNRHQVLMIKQSFEPVPLFAVLGKLGFKYYSEKIKNNLFHIYFVKMVKSSKKSLKFKEKTMNEPKWLKQSKFIELDARKFEGNFLQKILTISKTIDQNEGIKVLQSFEPVPLYSVMAKEGFEHFTRKITNDEFHVFFKKKQTEDQNNLQQREAPYVSSASKTPVVIQSATPVVYPILLKVLDSKEINKFFDIQEVKVWKKTEKHLGWIVSGKADISFSAIIASANLLGKEQDIKLANVTVWDNFYLVIRGYKAESLSDLKDKEIHMPLFKKAPPAQVTHFLFRQFGLNPDNFNFVYGEPFGRPEEIAQKLINHEIDTALIREPEVSYALKSDPEIKVAFSYSELWKQLNPDSMGLPNAGVVFKGELIRSHPELVKLFLQELDKAVTWVKTNPEQAALKSYQAMGHSLEEVKLFLKRVNYENVPANKVKHELQNYLSILKSEAVQKIIQKPEELFLGEEFFDYER